MADKLREALCIFEGRRGNLGIKSFNIHMYNKSYSDH